MLYLGEKTFELHISSLLKLFQWAWLLPTTIYDPDIFWVLSKKNLQWCYSSSIICFAKQQSKEWAGWPGHFTLFYLNSSCTKQNVHIVSEPLSLEVPGHESSASISLLNIYHWINKVSHRQLWIPRSQKLLIRQIHQQWDRQRSQFLSACCPSWDLGWFSGDFWMPQVTLVIVGKKSNPLRIRTSQA